MEVNRRQLSSLLNWLQGRLLRVVMLSGLRQSKLAVMLCALYFTFQLGDWLVLGPLLLNLRQVLVARRRVQVIRWFVKLE